MVDDIEYNLNKAGDYIKKADVIMEEVKKDTKKTRKVKIK